MRKGQKKRGCGVVRTIAVAGVTLWVGVFLLVVRQHSSATAAVPAVPASPAAAPLIRRAAEGTVLSEARDPLARPAPVSSDASAVTAPIAVPPPRLVPRTASVDPHTGLEMEVDSYTGLRVPAFWEPPPELAPPGVAKPPKRVGDPGWREASDAYFLHDPVEPAAPGRPTVVASDDSATIFVMIASYRDFQCAETASSALARAAHPERLVVAVVQQDAPGDARCDAPPSGRSCRDEPSAPLCKYASQVKVYEMNHTDASGPVFARHVGYRMYRGEGFVMQLDAHCVFVNNWDTTLVRQWRETHNEFAVLSTYLTDLQGSVTRSGDSLRRTRPIMCNSDYEGGGLARYLRHGSQPEAVPAVKDAPMLEPFWAAGFSFARGHFVANVPYDCCLPMVFMGEEISIGIRGWTHGYDFYANQQSVVFHEYAQESARRRHVPKFWEGGRNRKPSPPGVPARDGQHSLKVCGRSLLSLSPSLKRPTHARRQRLTALIHMAPELVPDRDYDTVEQERYGLGTIRDVDVFYKLFLVDTVKREAHPLCKFVEPGEHASRSCGGDSIPNTSARVLTSPQDGCIATSRSFSARMVAVSIIPSPRCGARSSRFSSQLPRAPAPATRVRMRAQLSNYDTLGVIDKQLYQPIVAQLQTALKNRRVEGLRAGLQQASRVKLERRRPELAANVVRDARKLLADLGGQPVP